MSLARVLSLPLLFNPTVNKKFKRTLPRADNTAEFGDRYQNEN
jgi:hypothetical protein